MLVNDDTSGGSRARADDNFLRCTCRVVLESIITAIELQGHSRQFDGFNAMVVDWRLQTARLVVAALAARCGLVHIHELVDVLIAIHQVVHLPNGNSLSLAMRLLVMLRVLSAEHIAPLTSVA